MIPNNIESNQQRLQSEKLHELAKRLTPAGVQSPVRSFLHVGVEPPLFVTQAQGAYLTDVDGHDYLDYIGAWGPMILGHADPEVVAAIQETASRGLGFGLSSPLETELCDLLVTHYPSMEKVRLVNSGTEATMTALRLARGYTKRPYIVKFAGCYHGHADTLLVQAGSGLATAQSSQGIDAANVNQSPPLSAPSSAGIPQTVADLTLVLPYNDLLAVEQLFARYPHGIAAVILEPVVGNMGCVPPLPGYLKGVQELCKQYGAVLIFDEVMTGYRVALGGAQERYGVQADLTTLSKIIGGGLPVGAVGGRRAIMDCLAPLGPVYQAGTLAGNPVAVASGIATLRKLVQWRHAQSGKGSYDYLESLAQRLENGLATVLEKAKQWLCWQRVGSMFTLFFTPPPVRNWQESSRGDHTVQGPYAKFHRAMLAQGILMPPSSYEAAFISLAHTTEDIDRTVSAMKVALGKIDGGSLK